MADLTKEQVFSLIEENLAEVLNPEIIKAVQDEGRPVKIYWGTATTGRPHCGYFVGAIKIAQFLAAGCDMTILLADIHGFLDNLKAPIELVQYRAEYYKYVITAILEAVGVPTTRLKFVLGSSYQKSDDYVMDIFKLTSVVSQNNAKRAGAEVVKQSDDGPLSGLLYPVLQVLDEQYLDCDAQFGGLDQRKLFTAATEWLPKLGYRKRAHLMNPMVPGLQGSKMSASDPDSKIDVLDSPSVVTKKLRSAFAAPKIVEENGILSFTEYVLLPAAALKGKKEFLVSRERDGLEPLVYTDIAAMHEDYKNEILTPQLLKPAVATALNDLLAPIQVAYAASPEWQAIAEKAYPPEEGKKKVKKVKNKGSRYPGQVPDGTLPIRPKEAGDAAPADGAEPAAQN